MKRASTATTHTHQSSGPTNLSDGGEGANGKAARKRPPKIVLIVACSQRKRIAPPNDLRLASIDALPAQRATQWRKRLRQVEAPEHPAHDIYAGDHWHTACEAYRLAQRYSSRTELWVISAGYGLIPSSKAIKPYSATFASGSADSVWRGSEDGDRPMLLKDWWRRLGHRATLSDLLTARDNGAVLIAAGAAYLDALQNDLQDALEFDHARERISVISAGSRKTDGLLPVDTRLRSVVGGTNSSLNARALRWLAAEPESHAFRRSAMSARLDRLTADLHLRSSPARATANDNQVAVKIRSIRRRSPGISRTRALQELRNAGIACEQERFASLWSRA
jgi:hypothetical protein